jgi:hypothetical protein
MDEQYFDGSAPPAIWPDRIDIGGRLVNRLLFDEVKWTSPRMSLREPILRQF